MEKIIDNGINSIRVGIEDYEQGLEEGNDARLSSAVRNVFAGILILAKGNLYKMSPAGTGGILTRAVRPIIVDGNLEWAQNGNKTIGYDGIKERFNQLSLSLDWKKLERVRTIRNDLEHFYHDGTRLNVQEALSDAEIVIHSLLELLDLDPIHDLGERWWRVLLENKNLYDKSFEACRRTFSELNWINNTAEAASEFFNCEECGSFLIEQINPANNEQEDVHVKCAVCGAESEIGPLMERAVSEQYAWEQYLVHTDGNDPPFMQCSVCSLFTLLSEANECAVCGSSGGH